METNWSNILMYVVLLVVPIAGLFMVIKMFLESFFKNEDKKRLVAVKTSNREVILPVRLQSYERIVLFLERISMRSLIMRVHKNGMTASQFHAELLQNIRSEFEHNVAQQIYVSEGLWNLVIAAKEETTKLVNIAAGKTKQGETSFELSQEIFKLLDQLKATPTDIAISALKREIQKIF